ncbi:MAG: chromatin protein Cren7 [Desulfurococcales archaeon]|nr:chromatin protein Cren7 [Desulfurococcales archaeon]MCE4622205.1 chromatin protein Cren7 [Desulfurococcales archaeon]MCE4626436.1 chromatin protein Cren7 [Desulfurococcales archaeon]MCE4630015.1 chromatin protein Cren7 [Desulfurococcales archaeon]
MARKRTKKPKAVKVRDPYTGKEVELVPKKVWELKPKNRKGVKIGLFKSETGKFFRAKVPDDYPVG